MITNNGYLLFHPDLRPMFQDMLKPFYNSVDLSEVELTDNELDIDTPDQEVHTLRKNMIDRVIGWKKLNVKVQMGNLKRILSRTNSYYYAPVNGTPFSLAIVLPEPYGHYRVDGQIEVKRRDEDYTQYFKGKNWRVHPEWVYCEIPPSAPLSASPGDQPSPSTPEETIMYFLEQAKRHINNLRWRTTSVRPLVYEQLTCK